MAVSKRDHLLRLSRQSVKAMQDGSVLETARVAVMLGRLARADRVKAIEGLGLLAAAALGMPKEETVRR